MEVRLLREQEIRQLIGPAEALAAVRDAFCRLARGEAALPGVIHLDVPEHQGEVHVKGAHLHRAPFYSFKAASGFYGNPAKGLPVGSGLVMVFDASTGFPAAILFDNGYLTELRTGAAGALATDLLARRSITRAGILGCGGQARYQLEALLGVRRPEEVVVWGRSADRAAAYASEMEARHGVRVRPVPSAEAAVAGSQLVITTTPARAPIVRADWIGVGTHVTAVGSDGADKQELDAAVLGRADKVVVDRLEQCQHFGELHHALEAGAIRLEDVYGELGDLAAGDKPGRTSDDEVTIADLTGVGVQDTAVAQHVVTESRRRGMGQRIDITLPP